MTKTKKYLGLIDDCAAGTVGTFELPIYMKCEDMIGARVKIKAQDNNGTPIIKRGKLIEILKDWG